MSTYEEAREKEQKTLVKEIADNVEKLEKVSGSQAIALKKHISTLIKLCDQLECMDEDGEGVEVKAAIQANVKALEQILGRSYGGTNIQEVIENEMNMKKLAQALGDYIKAYVDFLRNYLDSEKKKIHFAVRHLKEIHRQMEEERQMWDDVAKILGKPLKDLSLKELEGLEDNKEDQAEEDAVQMEAEPEEKAEEAVEEGKEEGPQEKLQRSPEAKKEKVLAGAALLSGLAQKPEEFYRGYKYLPKEVQEKLKSTDIEVLKSINTTAHPMLKEYLEHRITALKTRQMHKEDQPEKEMLERQERRHHERSKRI